MKEHLIHYFPFLNKDFRKLSDDELQSEEVFKELFPDEPIELHKLKAIALFQKDEFGTLRVYNLSDETKKAIKNIKVKPNAKI